MARWLAAVMYGVMLRLVHAGNGCSVHPARACLLDGWATAATHV